MEEKEMEKLLTLIDEAKTALAGKALDSSWKGWKAMGAHDTLWRIQQALQGDCRPLKRLIRMAEKK